MARPSVMSQTSMRPSLPAMTEQVLVPRAPVHTLSIHAEPKNESYVLTKARITCVLTMMGVHLVATCRRLQLAQPIVCVCCSRNFRPESLSAPATRGEFHN